MQKFREFKRLIYGMVIIISISFVLVSLSSAKSENVVTLYNYSKEIIIDHTQVSSNLTDFPFLFKSLDNDLKDRCKENGDDIDFYSSSDVLLD